MAKKEKLEVTDAEVIAALKDINGSPAAFWSAKELARRILQEREDDTWYEGNKDERLARKVREVARRQAEEGIVDIREQRGKYPERYRYLSPNEQAEQKKQSELQQKQEARTRHILDACGFSEDEIEDVMIGSSVRLTVVELVKLFKGARALEK